MHAAVSYEENFDYYYQSVHLWEQHHFVLWAGISVDLHNVDFGLFHLCVKKDYYLCYSSWVQFDFWMLMLNFCQ